MAAMHGASAATLQALHFVIATNGASVCIRGRIMWAHPPEHNTWSIPIDTSFELVNHPRSTAAIPQEEKQRYNASAPHVQLIFVRSIRTAVFPLFSLRHPRVSCQQHPEGGHPRPKHKPDVDVKSPNNPSFFSHTTTPTKSRHDGPNR